MAEIPTVLISLKQCFGFSLEWVIFLLSPFWRRPTHLFWMKIHWLLLHTELSSSPLTGSKLSRWASLLGATSPGALCILYWEVAASSTVDDAGLSTSRPVCPVMSESATCDSQGHLSPWNLWYFSSPWVQESLPSLTIWLSLGLHLTSLKNVLCPHTVLYGS